MADQEEISGEASVRTSRRQALKLGAAAGVGLAAWTGPQIGIIGATPAYAADCSPGERECFSQAGSVNWGTWTDSEQYLEFNGVPTQLTVQGQTVTFSGISGNKFNVNGTSAITFNVPAGVTCGASITVFDKVQGQLVERPDLAVDQDPAQGVFRPSAVLKGVIAESGEYSFSICCTTDPAGCAV